MSEHGVGREPQNGQRQPVRGGRIGGWKAVSVEGQHQLQAGIVLEGHVGHNPVQHLGPVGGHHDRHARWPLHGQAGSPTDLAQANREGVVGQRYRAKTTPHMYVINPAGQLVYNGAIDNSPNGRKGDEYKNFVAMALECVAEGREINFGARPYGCSVKYASGGGKGGGRRGRGRN